MNVINKLKVIAEYKSIAADEANKRARYNKIAADEANKRAKDNKIAADKAIKKLQSTYLIVESLQETIAAIEERSEAMVTNAKRKCIEEISNSISEALKKYN
jgi:hypothetical protein